MHNVAAVEGVQVGVKAADLRLFHFLAADGQNARLIDERHHQHVVDARAHL